MKNIKFIALTTILILLLIVIPTGFAVDDVCNETLDSVDDEILSDDYYFDSNSDMDGNGSADNPYKNFTDDRIKSNSVIHLASGEYNLSNDSYCSDVSFYGANAQNTILNGNGHTLYSSDSLTLKNITLINIKIQTGNIFELSATNTIFKNCGDINSKGGAIYSPEVGSITLTNCSFYNNSALYGGAIYMDKGSIDIFNSTFENNSALYGGAIYVTENWLEIYNSTFKSNAALMSGGAVTSIRGENLKIYNSSFSKNNADFEGGSIYSYYGYSSIFNSTFTNNSANAGGALFIDNNEKVNVSGNKFKNNVAKTAGAVYSLSNPNSCILNNSYIDNSAISNNDLLQTDTPYLFLGNGNYTIFTYNSSFTGELPSYYNLKDEGYITPVKDQGGGGNCWAFSSLAALESCILKASGISYDLSEENMKNLMAWYSDYGWNMEPNVGGYTNMAVGYLVSWLGPILESEDAYNYQSTLSLIFNSLTHIQNVVYITRSNYTDNDAIKRAIIDYGAVSSSIRWKGSSIKNYARYYNGDERADHAVAIVGWDDNYSKDNFAITPPGDGAWIIKNSHGADKGDSGYWYVSYYDVRLAQPGRKDTTYTFILNDTLKFDKNYQYDIPGKSDFFLNSSSTVWYKNIFNATDNEYLAAVSTFFREDTNYTFSILVNNVLKLTQSGFSKEGYYTINLNEFVPLEIGDIFEVIFKITVDGEAGIPISEKYATDKEGNWINNVNNDFFKENISFLSYDGENWTDLFNLTWAYSAHIYKSQCACIKAFTVFDSINTTTKVSINVTESFEIKAQVLNQYNRPVTGGNVDFIVNENYYSVEVVNGWAILKLPLNLGEYNISATYNNVGYISSHDSFKFNKSLLNTTISLTINENNPINITAQVFNEYGYVINNGNVTFTVDGVQSCVKIIDTLASLEKILKIGKHNVSVVFNSDDYYYSSNSYQEFNVSLRQTNVTLSVGGEFNPVLISVNVTDEFGNPVTGGNVTFDLDGEVFTFILTEGIVSFSRVFDVGLHNISVAYTGLKNYYNSSNSNKEFKVISADTKIKLTADNEFNPVLISVNVTDQYGKEVNVGNVTFILDKTSYVVDVRNGVAQLNYNFKNLGLNSIYAIYNGSYYYGLVNASAEVTVKTTILANDATNTFNSKYSFNLLDNFGNPLNNTEVSITIGSKNYHVKTDNNGVVNINIDLNPGTYSVKITNPINNETKTQTLTVVKRITENNDLTMYYGAGKYYTVRVADDNGNAAKGVKVTFTINGNNYVETTDNNGYASLKISQNPGKYAITAEYKGFKVSNKITVKSTIITKNIKVKKGKTIKFTAKLLNSYGKILKNKKITFKFKGKTYKVKTNKKGIATLKITKRYKVGKYAITTKYGKLTIKNTIQIKR